MTIIQLDKNDALALAQFSEPIAKTESFKKELLYRHIAYVNVLRLELRRQKDWQFLKDFLQPDEYEAVLIQSNKANYLLYRQSARLEQIIADGYLKENRLSSLDFTLKELCDRQSGCERIKQTPMLRQYQYFTRLFLWIFSTLLPFSFIEELGGLTIPFSTLISFIFTVLDLIGAYNEDPFENRLQDIPMTAICREIERDLKTLLNEPEIPPLLQPVNGILM
jgi:putative membrane protein